MEKQFFEFTLTWLGIAWKQINSRAPLHKEKSVKQFLGDAWEAYTQGKTADEFAETWQPSDPF